jgi:fructose-1,6-bisphosphatase
MRTIALQGNNHSGDTANVQGRYQQPLDVLATDLPMQAVMPCARVVAAFSARVGDFIWLKAP